MDKVDIANWDAHFSQSEQTVASTGRYTEIGLKFSEPRLAAGSISSLVTPEMTLIETQVQAQQPIVLSDNGALEGAESVFILSGDVSSHFTAMKNPLRFGKHQHSIQYSANFQGEHTLYSGNFHSLSISYNLPYLSSILQSADSRDAVRIGESIERKRHFIAEPYALDWLPRMAAVVQHIRACTFTGMIRNIFLESKMMELFVLQLEQLHEQSSIKGNADWSNGDREKLHAVKTYLEGHYLEPLTLKELVSRFTLNEFKLKKGFKHFFGSTVFGYIYQLRMQEAKELLEDGQMTVSEVAWRIGYEHVGSFSAAFKKHFGCNPGSIR